MFSMLFWLPPQHLSTISKRYSQQTVIQMEPEYFPWKFPQKCHVISNTLSERYMPNNNTPKDNYVKKSIDMRILK